MKKWRFLSNQNSTIVGINDAGIETFTANMNKSLVREIIQNSLDAVIDGCTDPVEVEFVQFDILRESIPDVDGLQRAINKCKKSNQNEPDAYNFFLKAEEIISRPKIKVLRISDHKTKGLEGTDTCEKGTSWSRLVKENGSSNKGQGSGGSFGIGKAAAFACSDLRTVFYSSKDAQGLLSNFGVAKLVSFEDKNPGDWTTGIGYYSEDEKFIAINEMANFDANYNRVDSGTDIYILGMHEMDDFENTFTQAVLLDFLVSLVNKKLVVRIQNQTIDSTTLSKYMSKLNPYDGEEIKDLLEYYHLLTSHDPKIQKIKLDSSKYGEKYGFKDEECTLYLKEGEGLNRKIMITRKAGMRILEQNRVSGSIDFTGVLTIEGNQMNEAFKKMEVPSHDAWEPGRVRGEEKKYNSILNDFRKYLRETVKDLFGRVNTNSMDALGASDFLPDKSRDEKEESLQKDEMSTRIKNLDGKVVEPSKDRIKSMDNIVGDSDFEGESGSDKDEKSSSTKPTTPQHEPDTGVNVENQTKLKNEGISEENLKNIQVKKRLMCTNAKSGIYTLTFIVPYKTSKAKLEFSISGEQSDYELPIIHAKVLNENVKVTSIQHNKIFLSGLEKGIDLKVEIQVDFEEYCMMGVEYYAFKK